MHVRVRHRSYDTDVAGDVQTAYHTVPYGRRLDNTRDLTPWTDRSIFKGRCFFRQQRGLFIANTPPNQPHVFRKISIYKIDLSNKVFPTTPFFGTQDFHALEGYIYIYIQHTQWKIGTGGVLSSVYRLVWTQPKTTPSLNIPPRHAKPPVVILR